MKPIALLFSVLLALATLTAEARERAFVDEPSSDRTDIGEGEKWRERGVDLPPYPEEGDLVEFQVDDPQQRFRYFIDRRNLSVGDDGVVRYTLVIRSPGGADNVSFEGMRCDAREFKVYAYGGRGQLKPLKVPIWERIKFQGTYRYHITLQQLYFCETDRYKPYSIAEIVRLLGETRRRVDDVDQDTGFL